MKKGSLLIIACLAFFVACEDKDNDTDFRDAWIGSYEGSSEYHHTAGAGQQFDTVYTNETLSVTKQDANELVIDYLDQLFPVSCTSEGTFTATTNNPHSEWYGNIKGDSLFFTYHDVSQGHSTTRHFKGSKK